MSTDVDWECKNADCKTKFRAKIPAEVAGEGVLVINCPKCGIPQDALPCPPYEFYYDDGSGWKEAMP